MCSLCRLPVAQNHNFFGKFWLFGGSCTNPLLPIRAKFGAIADPQYTLTCQISSRSVYSVALCWRKNPIFAAFWTSAFTGVAIGSSLRKVNTVHNYKPYPIQGHQNRFCTPTSSWRNRAHNLWHSKVWRTDRQTDKKLNVFGRPGGGWNPSPTNLAWW